MAIRYRRYRASSFRLGRQASVRELELTAVIVAVALVAYFSTRISTLTLWIIFVSIVFLGIVVGVVFFTKFQRSWKRNARAMQVLGVIDIDQMEPERFESYIETLVQSRGMQTMQTIQSDNNEHVFIAQKGRKTILVQLFQQKEPINAKVVHKSVMRRTHYGYNGVMLITTGNFTPAAKRLAFSHRCSLVDRQQLARWVLDFQEGR